jgi:hypothetical protein
MKTTMLTRFLPSCLLISSMAWATDCMPGTRVGPSVTSPDGQYRVSKVLCSNQSDQRALVLHNNKSGDERLLYTYTRNATILWSPDSRNIAINDYAGSDFTENLVFSVDQSVPPIDLKKQLFQSERRAVPETDHLYMSTIKWRSQSVLQVIVWGHGGDSPMGFCRSFSLSLDGKVQKLWLPGGATSDPEEYCERIKK